MAQPQRPRPRAVDRRLVVATLCLLTAGMVAVLPEVGPVLAVSAPVADPDVIVALGSHEWERLPLAVRLAHAYPRARVLLTTPVRPTLHNCHACGERVDWLVWAGVPRERVVLIEPRVRNTYDEAVATRSYALRHGARSVLAVTSVYHGRRALATFRSVFRGTSLRVGIETAVDESNAERRSWWMRANSRAYVAYETAAILWYGARYGINPFPGE